MRHDADLIIVGFGSAGMTAAELAADIGLRTIVVERDRAGGDCLWTGCVPSKALIAAARVAHQQRQGPAFGLPTVPAGPIDLAAVWDRVRAVRDGIAAGDDDPARFEAMGVQFRWGAGTITGPRTVAVVAADGAVEAITARAILLCPGGHPTVPPIDGLEAVGYLTNETIFELTDVPGRVVFVGGGPIAVELAQACCRLGIVTVVLQRGPRLLPRDEPALVDQLTAVLRHEGVDVVTGVEVTRVEPGPVVVGLVGGVEQRWATDAVVVAAGRSVASAELGLDVVGVVHDADGIVVDQRGRTNVPSIYAAGDVTGRDLFTHAAAHEAAVAVRDAFFPGRGRRSELVPWATFTDPALAHAGLTIEEAERRFGARHVAVHRWSLAHNDRAHADRTGGEIVLVERTTLGRHRLVGAHVLAAGADELIGELVLAIDQGLRVTDLAGIVHTYPTIATSVQQLGGQAARAQARRYGWLARIGGRRR